MPSNGDTHQHALALLQKADFDQGLAIERQIATHVRTLIQSGALATRTRLPPIRSLATAWDTNYFTVQTALRQLVREGLLVQSQRLGTFVSDRTRKLQRVCLYHGQDLSFTGGSEFHSRLHIQIYRMLSERGISTVSYFDHRPLAERHTTPEEIRNLIKDRQVDAVISSTQHEEWLTRLDVPVASMQMPAARGGVDWDVPRFARLAVEAAVAAGRKRVCVINRVTPGCQDQDARGIGSLSRRMEEAARGFDLEIIRAPQEAGEFLAKNIEETGFILGERVMGMSPRPDALVIFPDTYTRGVVSALLKHDARVPDDIMVISHRNDEMPFFTPFPVTWLTVKIESYAAALLRQVEQQIRGEPPAHIDVDVNPEATVKIRARRGKSSS